MVAAAQVVYSLQLGLGGVTAYASYNRYHHNLVRDTGLILATNLVWVVLASLLVLSLLGVTHNLQVGGRLYLEISQYSDKALETACYKSLIKALSGYLNTVSLV